MARQPHPLTSRAFPPPLVDAVLDDALATGADLPAHTISGVQGSGKSTLAAQLVAAGFARGLEVVALSICCSNASAGMPRPACRAWPIE